MTVLTLNIIQWRDALLESDLSKNAKYIGLVLSQFYRNNHPTYPSIRTLSQLASTSVNTVQPAIMELEKAGFIIREQRRLKGSSFISNIYIFCNVLAPHVSATDTSTDTRVDTQNDVSIESSNDVSVADTEVEEKEKKTKTKKKSAEGIKLPYSSLPKEWNNFCTEEMKWNGEQAESAFLAFKDYWLSAANNDPLKKDWFMTFKNSCRNGYTKPNVAVRGGEYARNTSAWN